MPKTKGRVFDTLEKWRRRLRCGGGDSATNRNIRRASGLSRSARAGSFDCGGHEFSTHALARVPLRTGLRQWHDNSARPDGHQARAKIGLSDRDVGPEACRNAGPADGRKGRATSAGPLGRGSRKRHRSARSQHMQRRQPVVHAREAGAQCRAYAGRHTSAGHATNIRRWKFIKADIQKCRPALFPRARQGDNRR